SCDFGGMARTSELAMADDAGDARRDPLWRELPVNLLPWRSAGARQPHSAGRHLGWASDADRAQSRWHPGDDRSRNAAELDQDQTKAATRGDLRTRLEPLLRLSKAVKCPFRVNRSRSFAAGPDGKSALARKPTCFRCPIRWHILLALCNRAEEDDHAGSSQCD